MEEITAAGLDIDQGMVVKVGGQIYYGPDAIHVLALMGHEQGILQSFGVPQLSLKGCFQGALPGIEGVSQFSSEASWQDQDQQSRRDWK